MSSTCSEHDPEEGVYGDEAVLEATDDELEHDLPRCDYKRTLSCVSQHAASCSLLPVSVLWSPQATMHSESFGYSSEIEICMQAKEGRKGAASSRHHRSG